MWKYKLLNWFNSLPFLCPPIGPILEDQKRKDLKTRGVVLKSAAWDNKDFLRNIVVLTSIENP